MGYYLLSARVGGSEQLAQIQFEDDVQFRGDFSAAGETRTGVTFCAMDTEQGVRDERHLSIGPAECQGTLCIEKAAKIGRAVKLDNREAWYGMVDANEPDWKPVALFRIRNMEPLDVKPLTFIAVSRAGEVWRNCSTEEASDWQEWSSKLNSLVSIQGIDFKLEMTKAP